MSSLKLPYGNTLPILCIMSFVTKSQAQHLSLLSLLSGLQRDMRLLLSLLFSGLSNSNALSSPHWTSFPALVPSSGCFQGHWHPWWTTNCIQGEVAPTLDRAGESPILSGCAVLHAPQNSTCPLGCKGMLLALAEPDVTDTQILLCWAALKPLIFQSVPVSGTAPPQVQNLIFSFIELHAIFHCSVLQSIETPLQGFVTPGSFLMSKGKPRMKGVTRGEEDLQLTHSCIKFVSHSEKAVFHHLYSCIKFTIWSKEKPG